MEDISVVNMFLFKYYINTPLPRWRLTLLTILDYFVKIHPGANLNQGQDAHMSNHPSLLNGRSPFSKPKVKSKPHPLHLSQRK